MRGHELSAEEKEKIIAAYSEGLTVKETSTRVGLSTGTVFNVVHEKGIARTRSQAHMGIKPSSRAIELLVTRAKGKRLSQETRNKISEAHKLHRIGHRKVRADGYAILYYPDYPNSDKGGYILEHRYIMENAIGRKLGKNEVVHHINHDKLDNRIENLRLMTSSEHMSLHMRERHEQRR